MTSLRCALGTIALTVGLLGVPATASADVVFPPPKDCPSGSLGEECHGPEFCRLLTCEGDRDCAPGSTCMEAQLCVRTINCGGMEKQPEDHVDGPCDGGGRCENGAATCQPHMVCMPAAGDSTTGEGTSTNGTTSGGGSNSGSNGGSNSGSNGGSNSGSNGGSNSGSNGGSNSGSNGGSNSGNSSNDGGGSGSNGSGKGGCGCRTQTDAGWLGGLLFFIVGAARRRR